MKTTQRGGSFERSVRGMKTSAGRDASAGLHGGEERIFRYPGAGAACLRTRRTNDRSPLEIGDSLLMDFGRRFFAVADASARCARASENLILKFGRMMELIDDAHPVRTCPAEKVGDVKRQIEKESGRILQSMGPSDSCTFTGILIINTDKGLRGIVLHSGDSLLFRYVPGETLKQISRTNFWMIGRSRRLYQLHEIDVLPGTTFVLSTDGLSDLVFPGTNGRELTLSRILDEVSVENVPERLLREHDVSPLPVDDLGMIVFKPEGLPDVTEKIILSETFHGKLLSVERDL